MSNGDVESHPRAGTIVSVDSRVSRLEDQVARLAIDVAVIGQAQTNLTSLVTTQHTSVLSQLTSIATDLRDFSRAAATQSSEPQATPAGRAILAAFAERDKEREKEHAELRAEAEEAKSVADRALLWTIRAAAVVAAVTWLLILAVTLFGPAIRSGLHLPG